ncbi:methyltransferase type 11 [Leptospira perolatii]|uniref:Methyltransferase type 11 n=1 Tax=Leptospira perolatii TaxID=2023191 RepID=A0A2M9ZP74_9LEPT|nr:class I SAM-dependent methyltransferase [Leptospira perolatii]PJZ70593.1 methyltransferase type 11 [Leptospira perolatii]PJZ73805.1 methyltransferase type 11 [Leptospira perolatii]
MSKIADLFSRFSGKGLYPHQFAWVLLLPIRNLFLSPSKLAERLDLKENFNVLEIGCGPGYFSPEIAKRIPKGKLFLTDIQPEMLEKARKRLERTGLKNFDFKTCDGDKLDYQDQTFDRIFLVTVLGEIENQALYAKEMFRLLRKGGIVSVSEQAGDPDILSVKEIEKILCPAGFVLDRVFGKGKTFTANFIKP